jgi:hypothetical protein
MVSCVYWAMVLVNILRRVPNGSYLTFRTAQMTCWIATTIATAHATVPVPAAVGMGASCTAVQVFHCRALQWKNRFHRETGPWLGVPIADLVYQLNFLVLFSNPVALSNFVGAGWACQCSMLQIGQQSVCQIASSVISGY